MTEVIGIGHYKVGYELRTERVDFGDDSPPVILKSAYTVPEGWYIGSSVWAHRLIVRRGIKPELKRPDAQICSIGFCEKDQKWYGWSHRAIYGYGVGDTVEEGSCCASSGWTDEYLAEHPEEDLSLPVGFQAKTLEDCKRMAVAFADAVS